MVCLFWSRVVNLLFRKDVFQTASYRSFRGISRCRPYGAWYILYWRHSNGMSPLWGLSEGHGPIRLVSYRVVRKAGNCCAFNDAAAYQAP